MKYFQCDSGCHSRELRFGRSIVSQPMISHWEAYADWIAENRSAICVWGQVQMLAMLQVVHGPQQILARIRLLNHICHYMALGRNFVPRYPRPMHVIFAHLESVLCSWNNIAANCKLFFVTDVKSNTSLTSSSCQFQVFVRNVVLSVHEKFLIWCGNWGWGTQSEVHYGEGGAYPEIHVLQYPLDMARGMLGPGGAPVDLNLDYEKLQRLASQHALRYEKSSPEYDSFCAFMHLHHKDILGAFTNARRWVDWCIVATMSDFSDDYSISLLLKMFFVSSSSNQVSLEPKLLKHLLQCMIPRQGKYRFESALAFGKPEKHTQCILHVVSLKLPCFWNSHIFAWRFLSCTWADLLAVLIRVPTYGCVFLMHSVRRVSQFPPGEVEETCLQVWILLKSTPFFCFQIVYLDPYACSNCGAQVWFRGGWGSGSLKHVCFNINHLDQTANCIAGCWIASYLLRRFARLARKEEVESGLP